MQIFLFTHSIVTNNLVGYGEGKGSAGSPLLMGCQVVILKHGQIKVEAGSIFRRWKWAIRAHKNLEN
jgi:hypothetical protein